MIIFTVEKHYRQRFQLSGYLEGGWWSAGWKVITEYWLRMVIRVFWVRLFCEILLNPLWGKLSLDQNLHIIYLLILTYVMMW